MKFLRAISFLSLLVLSACGSYFGNYWTPTGNYAKPIGQSRVTNNKTSYSETLKCLAHTMREKKIKPDTMTVGRVLDYTGKDDLETGRRLTQGATLMVISALAKAGIPQVERFDTSINEFELKMKDNKLVKNSIDGDKRVYQPIIAGSLVGSKYTIMGGITELNYNIRSNDMNAFFDFASGGLRYYVMNVAMDFRLVETETLQIVSNVSYQKQIIGREVQAGVFEFFDEKLLDLSVGERSLEPMQLAIRSISELAVYDLLNDLYKIPRAHCYDLTVAKE
jgi:curli production assembly/transport component CsgG/holdfast attachment protein HfaB